MAKSKFEEPKSKSPTRVLIVKESKEARQRMAVPLRTAGFLIDEVGSGKQATQLSGVTYDAIILDLELSDENGLNVLKPLRRYHSQSAVLVVSEPEALDARIGALDEGADDYLLRPFSAVELVERLRTVLRRKANNSKRIIQVGDLVINLQSMKVVRKDEIIELTEREFALLVYLAKQPNCIVSRAEILERVFESDPALASNVVDVYMSYLRKKIEHDQSPKLLHTFRRRGYMLGVKTTS